MSGDPILIDCEGSGCPPTTTSGAAGMCSMCGRWLYLNPWRRVPDHQRDDILARLARGDFNGPERES